MCALALPNSDGNVPLNELLLQRSILIFVMPAAS